MKSSYKFYRGCYRLARVAIGLFYWFDVTGIENIPVGAALICSNHSSLIDPLFIAFAFGIDSFIHFIAKVELFRVPVLSAVITGLGAISVDRGILDIKTIKRTLGYFKSGEKVAIFPEGTRAAEDDYIAAKSGAVKLAEHAGVPLVPVYIPRKKRLFRKMQVVIGKPYSIEKPRQKRTQDEYAGLADILMAKIKSLNPLTQKMECGV